MTPQLRAKLVGNRFSRKQLRFLQMIWTHASWDTIEKGGSGVARSPTGIDEDEDMAGREATFSFDEDGNSDAGAGGEDGIVRERITIGPLHSSMLHAFQLILL